MFGALANRAHFGKGAGGRAVVHDDSPIDPEARGAREIHVGPDAGGDDHHVAVAGRSVGERQARHPAVAQDRGRRGVRREGQPHLLEACPQDSSHDVTFDETGAARGRGMHFGDGVVRGVAQHLDPAGLVARLVVRHQAAGRQVQREIAVGHLRRIAVWRRMKPRPPAGRRERCREQARRSWMVRGGARPEQAVFTIETVVAHPAVVRGASGRRPRKFPEDLAGVAVRKRPARTDGGGKA